jgi:hypothetical protein
MSDDGDRLLDVDMYTMILAAESGEFGDFALYGYASEDEYIVACADAVRRSGLQHSVGWAGRFLRDVAEAFDGTSGQDRESYTDDQDRDSYTVGGES